MLGEVLMGTLRWEKEAGESSKKIRQRQQSDQKRRELQFAEARTRAQIKNLQLDLHRQRAELDRTSGEDAGRSVSSSDRQAQLRRRRSAGPAPILRRGNGGGAAK